MVRGRLAACSCVAAALALLHACGASVFACTDPSECPGGLCEPSGWCSFPDAACPSGQRYGSHAPSSFADACVDPIGPGSSDDDSGTDGTTTSTSGPSSLSIATLESSVGEAESSSEATSSSGANATAEASTAATDGSESDTGMPPVDACIVEDFDDGSIDGFSAWNDGGLGMNMDDGTLVVTLVVEPAHAGIDSPTMGFVERDLQVTVLGVPNQATSSQITMGVYGETSEMLLIHEYGVLAVRVDDGMTWENVVEVMPYDQTVWRIWTHGEELGFDRALPGGEWEPLWSGAAPFDLASAYAYLAIGTWAPAMAPGDARLDDLRECPYL